jgi:putative sigma-54 modulation protein
MLELVVRNANGHLTLKNKQYASSKLGKLDRYFGLASRVEMAHLEDKRGLHKVDVTVFADGVMLHGRENDSNFAAAVDKVFEKLKSRLGRLHSKTTARRKKSSS